MELFSKYDIDTLLYRERFDDRTIYEITYELSHYLDWNELCEYLKKTTNSDKYTKVSFINFIYELLFEQCMNNTNLSSLLDSPDFKGYGNKEMIEKELQGLLADLLVKSVRKNLEEEYLEEFLTIVDIHPCATEYVESIDFSDEIDAYLNIDDDYFYDSAPLKSRQNSEERYVDDLFEKI